MKQSAWESAAPARALEEANGPVVSVVTVCLNSVQTIRACLDSLRAQTWSRIEHVIIDGVSTDGTLDVVEAAGLPGCVVVSEKDTGIYNAMNKGFRKATGQVIGILNADDVFHDEGVIEAVARAFRDNPQAKWLYGITEVEAFDGSTFRMGSAPAAAPSPWQWRAYSIFGCVQQSIFVRRSFLEEVGFFEEGYRVCADLDLTIRMWKQSPPLFLNRPVGVLKFGGASFSAKVFREARQVHERRLGRSWLNDLAYWRYSAAHVLKRKPFNGLFRLYRTARKALLGDR